LTVIFLNYLGKVMPVSAKDTSHVDGTPAGGEVLYAPPGPSAVSGDGGGDTLIGSKGDNTFWITDPNDVIEIPTGQAGIKTAIAWTSYALPDGVQNLIIHMDFNYAVGNSLDNLIRVKGRQWVYGGGGDDVLVGGKGNATFVVRAGEGNDVIYGWHPGDQVQLLGTDLNSFSHIKSAMTQAGQDVVLQIDPQESLTFRDTSISDFSKNSFLTPLVRSQLGPLTFHDEFNTLRLYDPSTGKGHWQTNFGGNLKDAWAYTLVTNGELQAYVTPDFRGSGDHPMGYQPFSVNHGVLTITAQPFTSDETQYAYGAQYASGMINTLGTFQQKYGYFEMRAELPAAQGAWPAFWMEPDPWVPNIEADVMEGLGDTPNVDYVRAYGGNESLFDNGYRIDSGGFHTYGMLWTKDSVTFYYDGVEVLHGKPPSSWTEPLAMIANLAVGGWGGTPDPNAFPAQMKIDYIRAYALADGSSQVVHNNPVPPAATMRAMGDPVSSTDPAAAIKIQRFDDGSAPVTADGIKLLSAPPDPAHLPPGTNFLVWEDSGAVFAAVSDGGKLSDTVTLFAGTLDQVIVGTWLSDGNVALLYTKTVNGSDSLRAIVFNSSNSTLSEQELAQGSASNVHVVATAHGGFAVSWHDGSVVEARAYDAHAYDGAGWYGPVRELQGDLLGIDSKGNLVTEVTSASNERQIYKLLGSPDTPASLSIAQKEISHAEGDSGTTAYEFTVTRSWDTSGTSTVSWEVQGNFAHPASAGDFQNGVLPSGSVTFAPGETEKTVIIYVAGDTAKENDETFTFTLTQVSGAVLGRAVATGTIVNDDGSAPAASPASSAMQTQTQASAAPFPPADPTTAETAPIAAEDRFVFPATAHSASPLAFDHSFAFLEQRPLPDDAGTMALSLPEDTGFAPAHLMHHGDWLF
jgi:beta-glucanase (GH16 family)